MKRNHNPRSSSSLPAVQIGKELNEIFSSLSNSQFKLLHCQKRANLVQSVKKSPETLLIDMINLVVASVSDKTVNSRPRIRSLYTLFLTITSIFSINLAWITT